MTGRQHKAVAIGPIGFFGSMLRNFEKRTVAISAAPIGMPGWPELAACTASIASARMALAMSLCWAELVFGANAALRFVSGAADRSAGVMSLNSK